MQKIELEETIAITSEHSLDLVALDEALKNLADLSPRQSQIVELKYFGGLSEEEIARNTRCFNTNCSSRLERSTSMALS